MTAPALAAHRFVCCCLLGAALGVYYEFLRPLRPRYTLAADALFLTGCVWVWLIMSFRVCRGDLRLGYSAGLLAGALVALVLLAALRRRPGGEEGRAH